MIWLDICCITGYGKRIRKEKDLIAIDPARDDPGSQKTLVNPGSLSLVMINGDHSLSTSAVRLLLEQGAELVLLDPHGAPSGYLLPCAKSPVIEHAEKQRAIPKKRALAVAQEIVRQATRNKATLIRSMAKNQKRDLAKEVLSLEEFEERAAQAKNIATLLGIEGSATRGYYATLATLIPEQLGFRGRTRHPPRDPVNALLSYGYGILYSVIRTALVRVNLSPFYGVLHAGYKKQEPLVYDFIEEFRQPVVDRAVMTLIRHRQIDPIQFEISEAGCFITPPVRKILATSVLERLDALHTYAGRSDPISAVIENQAKLLAGALLSGKRYRAFPYR